jgi:CheY-like chemotaxis protein
MERMAKKRVLVVDDNRDITEMVQTMLEGTRYECAIANTGRECLSLAEKEKFDLILLDMAMPEMSGLDVLAALKDSQLAKDSKVVLVTASPMYTEMDLKKIRSDYGAIERVKKPFTDTELLAVIDKYVA